VKLYVDVDEFVKSGSNVQSPQICCVVQIISVILSC